MKALFITRKWPPAVGGMETYACELTQELARLCQLSVLALPGRSDGRPPSAPALMLFMVRAFFQIMFSKKVNVFHVGDLVLWPLAFVAKIFNLKSEVVITAYGLDIVYGSRPGLLPLLYKYYLALGVFLLADKLKVVAISNATASLCQKVGFKNIVVVPLGVSGVFREPGLEMANEKYVFFVGRLVTRKGAGWFASNVVPLLDSNIKFKVAGKPWDRHEIEALVAQERVDYLGAVSNQDLTKLRSGSIAVLMPNISTDGVDIEGFGLTALEAAVDGGVLLASGIEGILDAVVDGKTGFLLPAESPIDWANKIHDVMHWSSMERKRFVLEAQAVIKDQYSWAKVAEKTFEIYL